ncbi:MAG: tetratricopeptide repeat protein [candidate division NC10 bacterium]|nr:tetratricopeptide repeat protein [candidate division NC10 bacterium]
MTRVLILFVFALLSCGAGVSASDLSEYYYATATIKFQAGDLRGSLVDLMSAASEDPNNPDIQFFLGRVLLQMRDAEKGLAALQKAVELDPNRAEVVFYLGVAYSDSGDQQSSLSQFEKARGLDSSYQQACLYREGIAYSRLNLRAKAMEKFEEAKRIDPESAYGRSAQDYLRVLKPKRFDLYAATGMEWDSNVILKPEKARFDYDLPKKSDWDVPLILAAEYRPLMREGATIGLRYRFYQNLHFRLHDYDVTDNSGEVFASYHLGPVSIRPHYRYDYTHMDLDPFSQIHQAGLDLFLAEASFLTFQPFYYYQYRDFLYPINPANDRDGSFHQVGAFQYLFFSQQRSYLRLGGLYERDFAEGKHYDENGGRARAGFHLRLPLSIQFDGEGEYGRLFYPKKNAIFDRRRTDTVYSFYLQLKRDILWGLIASVRFSHIVNDSTIKDYEYHRSISSLFLSWNF